MRTVSRALVVGVLSLGYASYAAQAPRESPGATDAAPTTPSAVLQPVLVELQQTMNGLQPDKWKTTGTIKAAISGNIGSIRRDLEATLPPLLANADGAPNSLSQGLPLLRNVDALYDVLLRVTEVGNIAAPPPQSAALQHALQSLGNARVTLGDRLQGAALAQEQRVHSLEAAARAVPPVQPAPVADCPAPPKKRKPRSASAPKPAADAATTKAPPPPNP